MEPRVLNLPGGLDNLAMDTLLVIFSPDRLLILLVAIVVHLALFSSARLRGLFFLPVSLASDLILVFDQRYNRSHGTRRSRRKDSYSIAAFLVILGLITGLGLTALAHIIPYGRILEILVLASIIGIRPLMNRTRLMLRSLYESKEEARATLTLLTGRITSDMDTQAMAATGIETVGLWFVQWVVAPTFWYMLGACRRFLLSSSLIQPAPCLTRMSPVIGTSELLPGDWALFLWHLQRCLPL